MVAEEGLRCSPSGRLIWPMRLPFSPRMNTIKSASVCGLGKLGACIAATLAARGFDVVGVDIDGQKVEAINQGLAPVEEPLLAQTIRAGRPRLRATVDPQATVATDVTFFIP